MPDFKVDNCYICTNTCKCGNGGLFCNRFYPKEWWKEGHERNKTLINLVVVQKPDVVSKDVNVHVATFGREVPIHAAG